MKIKILTLLSALALSSVLAGCSADAVNIDKNNSQKKITLTNITYDSESKSLGYTLTNGTEDKLVDYTSAHKIYRLENGSEV